MAPPLRVVQWTTGNVGREAVPAVLARPDMELVGVFAAPGIRTYADLPLVTTRLGD
jgi:hypothetical protein